MKRKSLLTILAIALVFVLSLSVLTACDKNKHEFSSEWKFDETNHWHECTTKKHTDTTEKTPHVFTWTEKTPAGVHTDKVEKGVCECGYETERTIPDTATHAYGGEWKKDASGHWHESTCDAKAPTHEVMKSDFAEHTFDEGTVTKPADYGVVGEKKFTCTKCGYEKTETIDALGAKDNEIKLVEGKTLGKEYDGEVVSITKGDFVIEGNRTPTFMFKVKGADDNTYAATAPKKAGEYTVKVSVAATAEWKEAEKTFDFAITAKPLTAEGTKVYDGTDGLSANLSGVVSGDDITATVTMESKNVGAAVKEVMLAGAAKDNYTLSPTDVDASITAKPLTATASKVYDGTNTIADIIPEGVCEGEEVKVIVFMSNKNAGSIVTSLLLEGKDKDNYQIDQANVAASITPMTVTVEWEKEYDNSNIFTGEPVGMLEGDDVTVTVTMQSANVGAAVQSFELTGKDAVNYSLAREDVTAEIVKADIEFEISNASAFTEFFVGATNIPDPETNYVEIGDGYGEKTIVWEKRLEGGVWSRTLTKEEVRNEKTGTYQVRVQYAEGTNYRSAVTDYVGFTVNVKERTLSVKNFTGKTYDGTPVANFTYAALEDFVEITDISGVSDITSPYDGEKYLEFRKKGEEIYTKITSTNIPKNAAEYEYRIGITATEEWEAAVSEVKTFTIAQVEIKLEKGYVATSAILQNGDLLYLATHSPVAGEKVALRLVNGKAGLELNDTNSNYVKSNQKKQVSVQNNLDCFKLVAISTAKVSNYKIVKDPKLTSVEITVAPSEKGISSQIQEVWNGSESQKWIDTSVRSGYFMVGQTVIAYDSTGTKLFEAKIVKVHVGIGMSSKLSPSGCVIPSDGMVRIDIDITGVTYTSAKGGYLRVK